ncbi:TPA: helix-turn-helix domain-containing protein [Streptococcus suis]|nr:helix-turn-helix transcriptional regulator [Streptococcus suis]
MEGYIKQNIGRLLYARGMTQSDLAKRAGVSRQTVSKILSPESSCNPKLSTLIAISEALEIDFPDILERGEKELPKNFQEKPKGEYHRILNQNLKLYLRKHKQYSLTYQGGVVESTVSNLINNKYKDINFLTIEKLSIDMGISIDKLFRRRMV